ncbi:MAG: phosphoglycerate kinase, partial [Patescibacteria group bacterium]
MELVKNLHNIQSLETFRGRLQGQKVFLRADFNVPIQDGKITDAYRIDTTMKTFAFLKDEGAITIVVSHIETKNVDSPTLKPVFEYIQTAYPEYTVNFCENFLEADAVQGLLTAAYDGNFIVFENIRNAKEAGMSEKGDDTAFAEYLKSFASFYINDAFAVCHRAHTSVSKLPALFAPGNKVAGLQLYVEIQSLSGALNPKTPFVAILSGAKFST